MSQHSHSVGTPNTELCKPREGVKITCLADRIRAFKNYSSEFFGLNDRFSSKSFDFNLAVTTQLIFSQSSSYLIFYGLRNVVVD